MFSCSYVFMYLILFSWTCSMFMFGTCNVFGHVTCISYFVMAWNLCMVCFFYDTSFVGKLCISFVIGL